MSSVVYHRTAPAHDARVCLVAGLFLARVGGRVAVRVPSREPQVQRPLLHKVIVYVTDLKMVKSNLCPKNYLVLFSGPQKDKSTPCQEKSAAGCGRFSTRNLRPLLGNFPAFETERIRISHARHAGRNSPPYLLSANTSPSVTNQPSSVNLRIFGGMVYKAPLCGR